MNSRLRLLPLIAFDSSRYSSRSNTSEACASPASLPSTRSICGSSGKNSEMPPSESTTEAICFVEHTYVPASSWPFTAFTSSASLALPPVHVR